MKRRITSVAIITALMTIGCLNAQSTLQKKADELFSKFAYAKAIPLYEELAIEGSNSNHAFMRLAECYLLMREFDKSIPFFKRFINNAETPTSYYFKYAMALKSSGMEDEATEWLKKYKKTNKNDARVKRLLKDGSLATVVFNSNERYELEPVHFNTEFSEFGGFVHDGKLYFSSNRIQDRADSQNLYDWDGKPWLDIYCIEEGSDNGIPERMPGDINSKYHESSIVFSTDYKNDTIAYFTRNSFFNNEESFYTKKTENTIENYNNLKIYKAEMVNGKLKTTRELKMNADHYSTGHPSVNSNRSLLYFASNRPGGYGGSDIYYAEIHERGGVLSIKNAGPTVNTSGDELFPYINNEGQLFFSSDGHLGFGMLDVFGTVLNDKGEIIDVINLGKPLNSPRDDFGYYALDNGIDGYVSSNRKDGKGSDDIYKFKFVPSLTLQGQVTDAINHKPLGGVSILLYDLASGDLVSKTFTNEKGYYNMLIERQRNYKIEARSKTHPRKSMNFETLGITRATKKIKKDIVLEPVMDVKLLAGLNKIYFDFNKSNIRPDAAIELDKVVKLMLETYPELVIKLESHTDPVGSDSYNERLSEARAKSTYEYLISQGVPKKRIVSYKGYGESRLVNDCKGKHDCTDDELELNRRTEFPIVRFSNKAKRTVSNIE